MLYTYSDTILRHNILCDMAAPCTARDLVLYQVLHHRMQQTIKHPFSPLVLWESYAVWLLRNLKLIDYLTLQPYAQSLPFNKSCVQKQFITACTVVCILSMVIQFSLIRTLSIMSLFIYMEVQFK